MFDFQQMRSGVFYRVGIANEEIVCLKFELYQITYIAIFSDVMPESMEGLPEKIQQKYDGRNGVSVKFAVWEKFLAVHQGEAQIDSLYRAPDNFVLTKHKRSELMEGLAQLLMRHYDVYRPDFYFFTADEEKPGLSKLYRQICQKHSTRFEQSDNGFIVSFTGGI